MFSLFQRIKSHFAWRLDEDQSNVNDYYENTITGDRTVHMPCRGVMSPINFRWLAEARGKSWFYNRRGIKKYVNKEETLRHYHNRERPPVHGTRVKR